MMMMKVIFSSGESSTATDFLQDYLELLHLSNPVKDPCHPAAIQTFSSISDADVFCFTTNLSNPNTPDFDQIESDTYFDTFYLLLKIANSLEYTKPEPERITLKKLDLKAKIPKHVYMESAKPIKPIIIADGLLALDIIRCASRDLPTDIFFCPTPINAIAKSILGEHLKVSFNLL